MPTHQPGFIIIILPIPLLLLFSLESYNNIQPEPVRFPNTFHNHRGFYGNCTRHHRFPALDTYTTPLPIRSCCHRCGSASSSCPPSPKEKKLQSRSNPRSIYHQSASLRFYLSPLFVAFPIRCRLSTLPTIHGSRRTCISRSLLLDNKRRVGRVRASFRPSQLLTGIRLF